MRKLLSVLAVSLMVMALFVGTAPVPSRSSQPPRSTTNFDGSYCGYHGFLHVPQL